MLTSCFVMNSWMMPPSERELSILCFTSLGKRLQLGSAPFNGLCACACACARVSFSGPPFPE